MLRGITTFVCNDCGCKFKGMDIEWNATVVSAPVRCPHCGGFHTCSAGHTGLLKKLYHLIGKNDDEKRMAQNG